MMKKHAHWQHKRMAALCLPTLYIASSAIRMLLSLHFSYNPTIMPDEALYTNLARSLHVYGTLTMRSQPIAYESLLYPLLLSPLYSLPASVNLHRAIQLLNALLINTSVFPSHALALRITGSRRAALSIASMTALLPGLALSQIIMAESIVYPLLMTTVFYMHKALTDERERSAICCAICGYLLYIAKPGMVAVPLAFCISLLFCYLRHGNKRALLQLLSALIMLALLHIGYRALLVHVFSLDTRLATLYETQTPIFSISQLLTSANGLLLYAFFFPLSCCILPLCIPIAHVKHLPNADRMLLFSLLLSIACITAGICYVVYPSEYAGTPFSARIHLRYLEGFVPALLALFLSPSLQKRRLNTSLFGMMCYFIAACTVFTPYAMLGGKSHPVDALSLAVMVLDTPVTEPKTLVSLLLLVGIPLCMALLFRHGFSQRMRRCILCLLALCMVGNNAAGYAMMQHNMEPLWANDAMQVHALAKGSPVLAVHEDGGTFYNPAMALDMHARTPMMSVDLHDLMQHTATGGAYSAFLPRTYWAERAAQRTPETGFLVLDAKLLNQIRLVDGIMPLYTNAQCYALIPISEGMQWVHSALSGLQNGWVQQGSQLAVFDSEICSQDSVRVWLKARAESSNAILCVAHGTFVEQFTVGSSFEWIEMEIPIDAAAEAFVLSLVAVEGNVCVDTYLVM